jgi:hypothetical protein
MSELVGAAEKLGDSRVNNAASQIDLPPSPATSYTLVGGIDPPLQGSVE